MFERFTESARQAIFYARIEAGEFPTGRIELGHLAYGTLRADKDLRRALLGSDARFDELRTAIAERLAQCEPVPPAADLPLDERSKDVLRALQDQQVIAPADLLRAVMQHEDHWIVDLLRQFGAGKPEAE
jgi:ATP-dependent Clp protease ATP-binding subunit ClpA